MDILDRKDKGSVGATADKPQADHLCLSAAEAVQHYERASNLYKSGNLMDAISEIEAVLVHDPNFRDANQRLQYYQREWAELALDAEELERVVANHPKNAEHRFLFAKTLYQLGRKNEAKLELYKTTQLPDEHWAKQAAKMLAAIS